MQEEKNAELKVVFPDIEKLNKDYFIRYEKLKNAAAEKNNLNFEFLAGDESHDIAKVFAFSLIVVSVAVIFLFFPRLGFNPHFIIKILLLIVLIVLSGMLSALFNMFLKNSHKKKAVETADFFLNVIINNSETSELEIAALKAWSRRGKNDCFLEIVKERIKLISAKKAADPKLLSDFEEHINRITKIDRDERRKAEVAENAQDKAEWEVRLKEKESIREALRQRAYRSDQFDKFYDKNRLKSELIPVAENLSSFELIYGQITYSPRENDTNPLNGDLFMAVSPDYLVLFLGMGVQTTRDKAEFLLSHNRTYAGNVLYIIPPEFIVGLKRERNGLTYIGFAEHLQGIPVKIVAVNTQAVTHQKIKTTTSTYTGPLKEIRVKLDEKKRNTLDTNFDLFAPKIVLDPVCPICKKFSHMQKTGGKDTVAGWTCTSCGTRYRWGVDYLRRVKLFPVKNNEKNADLEKWV